MLIYFININKITSQKHFRFIMSLSFVVISKLFSIWFINNGVVFEFAVLVVETGQKFFADFKD